jgi:hypothetical protein
VVPPLDLDLGQPGGGKQVAGVAVQCLRQQVMRVPCVAGALRDAGCDQQVFRIGNGGDPGNVGFW